jgi:hypothetical protein
MAALLLLVQCWVAEAGTMQFDLLQPRSCCALPHYSLNIQVADGSLVAAGAVLGGSSRHYAL